MPFAPTDQAVTEAGAGVEITATATRTTVPPSPYVRRKRAVAACQFCRLRKTKCDNVRPVCGSCRHHQARCVYTDGSEADGLQVGLDDAARRHHEVMERLEKIQDLLARSSSLTGARLGSAVSGQDLHSPESSAMTGIETSLDRENGSISSGQIEMESASGHQPPPSSFSSSSAPTAYLQYTKCEAILKWPVLSVVMTEEDAAIDSFIFDTYVRGDGEEAIGVGSVAAPTTGGSPSTSPASYGTTTQQPTTSPLFHHNVRDQPFVTLCQRFLALVNCRNPLLDAYDLLSYARSVAEDGLAWDAKSCLVVGVLLLVVNIRPPFSWRKQNTSAHLHDACLTQSPVLNTACFFL